MKNFYNAYASDRAYVTGKCAFLLIMQLSLLVFLLVQSKNSEDLRAAYKVPAANSEVILASLVCALILHISLTDEI